MQLPKPYAWLAQEPGPKILRVALTYLGVTEIPGQKSNPVIIKMAVMIGGWIASFYKNDDMPWCGLFIAVCAKLAGFPFNQKALSALAWKEWGVGVKDAMLGDVVIFQRPGGGHVGLYVGEDEESIHTLGGNQGNTVCITRIPKSRLVAVRRCAWRSAQPPNVRRVFLAPTGKLSRNEA
jgi:uncharacterized protein (TIGR02594 family)